mmetsp:Transcript_30847/g.83580  ORF Transcript_30847/g.83580 Transcript_30847/m.83580 type:complete len:234 (+) Transcript_30847:1117-1818(+)
MSLAASKDTTVWIEGMSRPRAATSVAISTSTFRFLKFLRIRMRSPWSRSPCRNPVLFWRKSVKFCVSSSALAMDFTKMRTWPLASISSTCLASHAHLSSSFFITSTHCTMFEAACPPWPTVMRTGWCSKSRASFSIFGGKVAEKSKICRVGRTFCTMERTWYSKPMENMRSASSSTTKVTRRKLQPFILTTSIKRPGLPIAISAPRLTSLNCSNLESPPAKVTLVRPRCLLNL